MNPNPTAIITVLIADDHPLFRSGVRVELERIPNFKVLAETGDGEEALRLIMAHKPDVAVVDFQMPKLTGLELARKAESAGLSTKIILLTMHRDRKIFFAALDAGVRGYVLKDDAITDIGLAIQRVAGGSHFISSELTDLLIEKNRVQTPADSIDTLIGSLTVAEKKVLALIAELKSNDEIAGALFISKRTVENHKVSLAGKLRLGSSKQLLRFALQNKDRLV
jgi:DNA-binding NarL/FixJ family response regulator